MNATETAVQDPICLSVKVYEERLPWSHLKRWQGLLERANVPLFGKAVFPEGVRVALRWRSEHNLPQWYRLEPDDDLEALWPDEVSILFVGKTDIAVVYMPRLVRFLPTTRECLVFQLWGMKWKGVEDPILAVPILVIPIEGGCPHPPKEYIHPSLARLYVEAPKTDEYMMRNNRRWRLMEQVEWREALERATMWPFPAPSLD